MNTSGEPVAAGAAAAPAGPDVAALLAALDRPALEAMDRAGALADECRRALARTGDNVVGELLRDRGTFHQWNHYPKGDVFDRETGAQYFYHAHPPDRAGIEHGHFHTFMRPRGMPEGVRPLPVPGFVAPAGDDDAPSHLVAVSMDRFGRPLGLFTTNRWVTGEVWYAAGDVIRMLDGFGIGHARPSWPTNLWIGAVLRLFRPQIEWLLVQRDARMAAWQAQHPATTDIYEDRRLEIASRIDIAVESQRSLVSAALRPPRRRLSRPASSGRR